MATVWYTWRDQMEALSGQFQEIRKTVDHHDERAFAKGGVVNFDSLGIRVPMLDAAVDIGRQTRAGKQRQERESPHPTTIANGERDR
jgi:hypothetical protein